jgi:hypothetical protein
MNQSYNVGLILAQGLSTKTIIEPAREIKVCREANVVVVGVGPGDIGSAIAATRSGPERCLSKDMDTLEVGLPED